MRLTILILLTITMTAGALHDLPDPNPCLYEIVSLNSCTTNTSKNAHALKERYFGV